ncbi:MAG: DEAD/DEAH box helicase [Clostridia bacterium]|nr:DEAD/DEAH box helicase [Clostridia bacterium]
MEQPKFITWDWRALFSPATLDLARKNEHTGKLFRFTTIRGDAPSASGEFVTGYRTKCRAPASYSDCVENFVLPENSSEVELQEWKEAIGRAFFTCSCTDGEQGLCAHEATVLLHWERERGSFRFRQTEEERLAAEKQRRRVPQPPPPLALAETIPPAIPMPAPAQSVKRVPASDIVSIAPFFSDMTLPEDLYFSLKDILSVIQIDSRTLTRAQTLLPQVNPSMLTVKVDYGTNSYQELEAKAQLPGGDVSIHLYPHSLCKATCQICHANFYENRSKKKPVLCEHEAVALHLLCDHIIRYRPGDATDRSGNLLLREIGNLQHTQKDQADTRYAGISIHLGVRQDRDKLLLIALYREPTGKLQEIPFPSALMDAERDRRNLHLPGRDIDFKRFTIAPASRPAYALLQYAYLPYAQRTAWYMSGQTTPLLVLRGIVLDRFYALYEGKSVPVLDAQHRITGQLEVGPAEDLVPVMLSLTQLEHQDVIAFSGRLPQVLCGDENEYLLSDDMHLTRLAAQEKELLQTLYSLPHNDMQFLCNFGMSRYLFFARRVLPVLQESPLIALRDVTPEDFWDQMPSSCDFTFYLSKTRTHYCCRITVGYGKAALPLPYVGETPDLHDVVQESYVLSLVSSYFPEYDGEKNEYRTKHSDESLFVILHDALPDFERLGKVYGGKDFPKLAMAAFSGFSMDASLSEGMLSLDIHAEGLDRDELLGILRAYREKQRYHRLKSGAFLDVYENEQKIAELISTCMKMDVIPEDIIRETAKFPAARAALIDEVLRRTQMETSRDDYFLSFIDKLDHLKELQFDLPKGLRAQMRPYQVAGYSWMRTLISADFGGILADDMGLGKTLQALSVILALKQEGEKRPAIIVCPASLVYNWVEEIRRFTPKLKCEALAGTASAREVVIDRLKVDKLKHADIYITSYDLCRRDIMSLKDVSFSIAIIDEAQYIKNTQTGMARAVKLLQARHRFALTGTPIENRLAELWSIFDFLMPGFLFDQQTFREKFDYPITEQKDPDAIALLSKMTSPFILRRLKTDVLKELPEKLEEVRTVRLDDEQRKLYIAQSAHAASLIREDERRRESVQILAELMRMRQICCDPSLVFEDYKGGSAKREACLDLVQSAIDGGHRILLFSQFTSMLDLLAEDLSANNIPYFTITGTTPKEERVRLVNDFNTGTTPVFLISLKAGGTGLNLVGADVVIHYDPWWNLAAQNQATDRAHRIGQTRQVTVFRLIASDTIEERIVILQEAKKNLADAILEGSGTSLTSLSREELLDLLDTGALQ